jgi:hypothetical protein
LLLLEEFEPEKMSLSNGSYVPGRVPKLLPLANKGSFYLGTLSIHYREEPPSLPTNDWKKTSVWAQ